MFIKNIIVYPIYNYNSVSVRACVCPFDVIVPRFNGPAEPARTVGFRKREPARTVGFRKWEPKSRQSDSENGNRPKQSGPVSIKEPAIGGSWGGRAGQGRGRAGRAGQGGEQGRAGQGRVGQTIELNRAYRVAGVA